MKKISVVINTYNAEKHLEEVLTAVKDFDEVVICDMDSTDGTLAIAERFGCKIVCFREEKCSYVEPARNFAIQSATHEYVLLVDADEVVTPELKNYLYNLLAEENCPQGVKIPRKNFFMRRFMRSTYPDHLLRFFKKDCCNWPRTIHSQPTIKGRISKIPAKKRELAFIHLDNPTITQLINKLNNYTTQELEREKHKKRGVLSFLFHSSFRFYKFYVIKQGWRDGIEGFIYISINTPYKLVTFAKNIEQEKNNK